jgi:Predicted RNA-binding protein (contains KH domain)
MKDYIAFIAKELVDKPEEVQVTEVASEQGVTLELRVAKDELGKIIGRQGRMAKVLRTVLAAASARSGQRAMLDIIE